MSQASGLPLPLIRRMTPQAVHLKAAIYADPGVGKTTMLATAQDHPWTSPTLFIDMEGGMASIAHRTDLDYVRVQTLEELDSVFWFLAKGGHQYKSCSLDSLSEMQLCGLDKILVEAKGLPRPKDKPARLEDEVWIEDYGRSTNQMRRIIRQFRDLPMHVFFSCLVREDKDEKTGRLVVQPRLTPGVVSVLLGYVDLCGYMYVHNIEQPDPEDANKTIRASSRRMLLQPWNPYYAKDRLIKNVMLVEEPTIPKLIELYRAALAERTVHPEQQ